MNKKRFFGIILIVLSFVFYIPRFTGAVVGVSSRFLSFVSLILFILGVIVLFLSLEKRVRIRGLVYDSHAIERMKERNLFPSIVENAINSGEHYKLSSVLNDDETKGATDVYISRDSADVMHRGKGRSSGIIEVSSGKKREYRHVIVMTGNNRVVKTAYTANEHDLRLLLKNYAMRKAA